MKQNISEKKYIGNSAIVICRRLYHCRTVHASAGRVDAAAAGQGGTFLHLGHFTPSWSCLGSSGTPVGRSTHTARGGARVSE